VSFATDKEKSVSEKTVLVEIDLGKEHDNWVNYRNGVWTWTFHTYKANHTHAGYGYGNYLYGPYGYSGTQTSGVPSQPPLIGSVYASGTEYTEQSTLVNCVETEESYYYDVTAFKLYVHTTDNNDIALYLMIVGFTHGVSNRTKNFNSIYYEPRLTGVPVLKKTKDPLYFGVIKYDGGTLTLSNADGHYDHLKDNYTLGQPVTIKYGFDNTYANYETLFKGYVENLELTYNECLIEIMDTRKKLSRVLPTNFFDQNTYPYLSEDDVGKPIPIFYGQVKNAPVICVNPNEGGSPAWIFKVCDVANHSNGIEAITAAYVDGVSQAPTPNLTAGTFTIGNNKYTGTETVTFDGKGLHDGGDTYIEKALDVIEDLLSVYLLITYDATNYDTTAWAAAEANALNNNVGLWIDSPTEIIELIEMLCTSTKGNFIRKDSDGKYTFRFTDIEASSTATIIKEDYQDTPRIYPDGDSMLSVVRIGYNKNIDKDSFSWDKQDSERTRIFSKYTKDRDLELETALISSADAEELAEALYELFDDAEPIVELVLWSKYLSLEIMDVITVPVQRIDGREMIPTIIGEVIHLNKNPLTGLVTVQARRLRDA